MRTERCANEGKVCLMAFNTIHMCNSSDMVCLKEGETSCTVHDTMPCAVEKKLSIVVRPSYTVGNVFNNVSTQFPNYQAFDLVLQSPNQEESVLLNDKKEKPLYEIPGFRQNEKNTLVLMPVGSYKHNVKSKVDIDEKISPASEDEIALGESASPTEPDPAYPHLPNTKSETSRRCDERFSAEDSQQTKLFPTPKIPKRYVGLVNQAMTCYLNSLLQALFMTPEFRNALYNWVFDQEGEAKSIPYQLQKLFLNLQTSTKIAIETTDLTKSFGWRSNEAWHQHDIQELCRVMFEALENKFKNTDQADLINNLYQGKMMDYVKCLECCTEKSREDTFLDIPLPVRPFKSAVAYGSVEEALRAFVQPETLDGNNQYFCEKCNKKCDAHKGLKFTKFPYILTLHLKRFDFDYETLHRIKLNDMVTFPQTLNVSSFIKTEGNFQQNHNHVHVNGFANESENGEKAVKFDDCSTTDSGAALEEDNCSGTATIASSVQHDCELQDDDEGIDMSSSTDNRSNTSNESNQYMYDLFAIMIHSGSASGGHYYAYIKDFDTGEWYCFNDQSVTPITQDDIEKSYGGGTKAYYSGAYSSSTNAYMLMYRQIDVKRNASAIKTEQFPDHIKSLLQKLKDKDEEEKKPIISDLITRRVHFYNPALKTIKNSNIRLLWDSTFDHVLKRAHGILEVENFAPISRCRLVAYDHQSQEIERSLEGRENDLFGDVVSSLEPHLHFLLETRGENEEFDVYEPGGFTMKVFKININNGDIDGPYLVRAIETQSVQSFKKKIAKELRVNVEELIVVLETSGDGVVVLKDDAEKLYPRSKVYVACEKNYTDETGEKLKEFVNENFANMTFLYVSLPQIDKVTLKILDIPEYVPRTETKESSLATPKSSPVEESISTETKVSISSPKKGKGKKDSTSVSPKKEKTKSIKTPLSSPKKETTKNTVETTAKDLSASKDSSVPPSASPTKNTQMSTSGSGTGSLMTSSCIQQYAGAVGGGGESNSEDSSLSDGDRTLVETAPLELSRVSSLSHSPQLSSPDDDICGPKSPPYLADDIPTDEEDDENLTESERGLYFRAYLIQDYDCMTASFLNGKKSENDYSLKDTVPKERKLKVFLDKRMKISSLKRALEPHIQVSADYFKIVRKQTDLLTFDDAEEISIELGQVLKKGEYRVKVYYLKLNQPNNESISFPFICEKVLHDEIPIPVFKKDILDHIHKLDPKYHTITMENSRLWDKNGRSLSRILQDDDIINSNLMFSTTCEIVIQEHEDAVCPVGSEDSLTLFVRRYCPSTLELQPFQEITLEKNDELKETLSKLSGISVDNIVYYKDTISFPVTNFDPNSIPWLTNAATLDDQPLLSSRSSSVYFYKDKTEETKKLTKEEKCDLVEKHRFEQILGFSSSYSPRREHSLKIYTDPSPVKTDKPSSADVDK